MIAVGENVGTEDAYEALQRVVNEAANNQEITQWAVVMIALELRRIRCLADARWI